MALLYIAIALIAVAGFWLARIIKQRATINSALAEMDIQLAKRQTLIANILKISQDHMVHEQAVIHDIATVHGREQMPLSGSDSNTIERQMKNNARLHGMMTHLLALSISYPQIRLETTFIRSQQAYETTEEQIIMIGREYNIAVDNLNERIITFPGSLLATLACISPYPSFNEQEANLVPAETERYVKKQS